MDGGWYIRRRYVCWYGGVSGRLGYKAGMKVGDGYAELARKESGKLKVGFLVVRMYVGMLVGWKDDMYVEEELHCR